MRLQFSKFALAALAGASVMIGARAATAQAPASAGQVAIIDMQTAILSTAEGKAAMADLKSKYTPQKNEINTVQQQASALQDQIQKQMTTLTTSEYRRLTHELQDKQQTLKTLEQDANNDFSFDRETAMRKIGKKMLTLISQYAKEKGFTLVIDPGSQTAVYYAAPGVDITATIVKLYDQAHPATAASSSAPTPSK